MSSSVNASRPALAHQFDDLAQQHEADELGMWLFLGSEVMFFGGLFLVYAVYRVQDETTFAAASRELDVLWGAINTAVLLTSSLTIANAGLAAELSQRTKLIRSLVLTFVLGTVFLGIKGFEYHEKYLHHLMPLCGLPFHWDGNSPRHAELFFDLYFLMTGMHALHMVIGLGVMLVIITKSMRGGLLGDCSAPVRILGLYWHFVDIVWVFLFPLLYLVGVRS